VGQYLDRLPGIRGILVEKGVALGRGHILRQKEHLVVRRFQFETVEFYYVFTLLGYYFELVLIVFAGYL
jgi:hypothetical protein